MKQILALREKRAKAWDAAKAFLDTHRSDDGLVSAEDNATYEKMEADVVALGKDIERLERQLAIDAELNQPLSKPLVSKPGDPRTTSASLRATDEYKQNFWQALRNKTPRIEVLNALQVGTDSEGGYLVPEEYERTLVMALEEQNVLRTLCHIIHTESGDRKIPLVVSHGTASWVEEEGAIPESDDIFGQLSIGAHKLATMIKVSDELLQDSIFNIPDYIATEFARRVGAAEEEAFLTGDGLAKPTGLLNATGGATVGVTTAGTSFTADELLDLVHAIKNVNRRNATFLMHDSSVKALRKLKDGNGNYIWQTGLREGEPDKLLDHPVQTSAFMPQIAASNKVILFGDFKAYWIADRQGRSFQRLNELFAATGQVGFRATQRVDGRLVRTDAMTCLQIKTA